MLDTTQRRDEVAVTLKEESAVCLFGVIGGRQSGLFISV